MEKDIFNFADAIQIDHLNDEQIKTPAYKRKQAFL